MATPPSQVKWGLPLQVLCSRLDDPVLKGENGRTWEASPVRIGTHNPCTMRVDAAETSMDSELTRLGVGVCGQQEARDKATFSKVFLER